jgi:hypothetical protein
MRLDGSRLALAMVLGTLLACSPLFAQVTISWPRSSLGTVPDLKALRGAPDGRYTGLGVSDYVLAVDFNHKGKPVEGTYSTLEDDLGLPKGELSHWDLIAFEVQSRQSQPSSGGWESSIWFVTDMVHAAAGPFPSGNASSPPLLSFKTGPLTPDAYQGIFKKSFKGFSKVFTPGSAPSLCSSSPKCSNSPTRCCAPGSIAWILVRIPREIDTTSPLFRVYVSGASIGKQGSPDPDAIGVIRHAGGG